MGPRVRPEKETDWRKFRVRTSWFVL